MNRSMKAFVLFLCALPAAQVPESEAQSKYKDWAELEATLVGKKMLHQPIRMLMF